MYHRTLIIRFLFLVFTDWQMLQRLSKRFCRNTQNVQGVFFIIL